MSTYFTKAEMRLCEDLILISQAQLRFIAERLSEEESKLDRVLFMFRNWRLKQNMQRLVVEMQAREGDDALRNLMEGLKHIEEDEADWSDVGKEEMDYIRLVLNGLHDVGEYEEVVQELPPSCH